MIKNLKKIIFCICISLLMFGTMPTLADTVDVEKTTVESVDETEETTQEEVEETTEQEIVESTSATEESIEKVVESTEVTTKIESEIVGEIVEQETVESTEEATKTNDDIVASESDAEEVEVTPEKDEDEIEESTTYEEEPEEDKQIDIELDLFVDVDLLGKKESNEEIATDSEVDEIVEEEVEKAIEEEQQEATPSEVVDLEVKTSKKLGAPATDIYMYLDTGDNTKIHYTSLSTVPASVMYNGGTIGNEYSSNNVATFLSGSGLTQNDITEVIIDDDLYPTNPRGLFSHYTQITSITNFNKLHLDNATSIEGMFTHCDSLTSVDMSGWNLQNVTRADYLFAVSGITSVNMSAWSSANSLQNIKCMFMSCAGLTSVDLNAIKTDNITDYSGLFYYAPNIVTIDMSSFNISSATTTTQFMFQQCGNLENIYVGSGFVIPATANSTDMFSGCVKLPGYDPANVDGSMVSTYTKEKPAPPTPPPSSGGSNSGSGGGGGGGMSGPIKQKVVLPTSKTNIWIMNNITGRLNFISEADKVTVIANSWVQSDVQGVDGRYIVDKYGDILTGFVKVESNLYYFSEDNTRYGKMLVKEEIDINGEKYYFDDRGVCITPKMPQAYYDVEFYNTEHQGLITHLGYYFNFDDNKIMTTGLKEINGSLYYFSETPNTRGRLTCGQVTIGGVIYYFDPNNGGKGAKIGI